MSGAQPHIGSVWTIEAVVEDRLEYICDQEHLSAVIQALKDSHPYEEPPIEIYKLENASELITLVSTYDDITINPV